MLVIEAMAYGAPAIAGNDAAVAEFTGRVARLLADARIETPVEELRQVFADELFRRRMAIERSRPAYEYNWRGVTKGYLELIVPLVRQHSKSHKCNAEQEADPP